MSEKDDKYIEYLHKKVDAFADLMKERMELNKHKDHWKESHFAVLFMKASKGMGSLGATLLGDGVGGKSQILSDAADIANHLMMIVDNEWELTSDDVPLEVSSEDSPDSDSNNTS